MAVVNARARPEDFQRKVNDAPLIDQWQMVYRPQLHRFNISQTVALDTYFFNACDGDNLACIMELFYNVTGVEAGMVKSLEREDIVLLAPANYLLRYNLVGLPDSDVLIAANFDPDELFLAVDRLMKAIAHAYPPNEAPPPAAIQAVEKIPRPPNAFILYRKSKNEMVKLENPGLHNNQRSKIIGASWAAESQEIRDFWLRKADDAKRQHIALHPHYKYQPRKPAEKKRRMTKKKAAALAVNLRAQTGLNIVHDSRPLVDGVYQHASFSVNDSPPMYYHGENDFRLTPPGSESSGVEEFNQNSWGDLGDDFMNQWLLDDVILA